MSNCVILSAQSSNRLIPDNFNTISPRADMLHQADVANEVSRKLIQSPEDARYAMTEMSAIIEISQIRVKNASSLIIIRHRF